MDSSGGKENLAETGDLRTEGSNKGEAQREQMEALCAFPRQQRGSRSKNAARAVRGFSYILYIDDSAACCDTAEPLTGRIYAPTITAVTTVVHPDSRDSAAALRRRAALRGLKSIPA